MKKLGLEVGDKVIIREDLEVNEYYEGVRFASDMGSFRGREVAISYVIGNRIEDFHIAEDEGEWHWSTAMIDVEKTKQLQSKFTKSDLKNGHVIETRGKNIFIVMIDEFDLGGDYLFNQHSSSHTLLDNYDEDLQMLDRDFYCLDICKVYQPLYMHSIRNIQSTVEGKGFKLVWERLMPKKMTLAEIEKELGYPVEITE